MIIKQLNFIQNHSKRDIQSQITLICSGARYARAHLAVISAFININIDLGISKNRQYNKQTHTIERLQE